MNSPSDSEICIEKCKGWCCLHQLKIVTPSEKEFYEFCGHKVRILNDGRYVMAMPCPCQYLEDGKCTIYGTGKRHIVCRTYPNKYHEIFAPHCELMRKNFK